VGVHFVSLPELFAPCTCRYAELEEDGS